MHGTSARGLSGSSSPSASQHKHATSGVYAFVPDLPFDQEWTDAKLYERYGLTEEEVAFIESQVAEHDDTLFEEQPRMTMNKPTVDEILAPKPEARPRIYAYSIADAAHKGLLKVGQTTRDVKRRVAEQVKTAAIKNYRIELDESAARDDGPLHRPRRACGACQERLRER